MNRMFSRVASVFISLSLLISPVFADIDALLDNIVYGVSTTSPGDIRTSTRTTYTLGSLSFRLRTDLLDQPVFSFQPPRATLSCSGADFDAGWLSIMNLSTFSDLLQQAGTQFMWGIVVGLAYSLPGIATSFDWLQKWGRMAQQLAGNMCNIGVTVGKDLGSAIFEARKNKAAEEGVGSGSFSAFTEAFKSFRNFFDMAGFFGAFPVDILENSGWMDRDTRDLVATVTGILAWYPMDENGNICTNKSCIKSSKNIKVIFEEPDISVLNKLIGGGTVTVYDCDYQVYVSGWGTCRDGVIRKRTINTPGLRAKIFEKLRNVRDAMLSGAWSGSVTDQNTQFVASMTYFYPNLPRVINASALLKKKGLAGLSDAVLESYADLLSAHLIMSLIYSLQSRLTSLKGLYYVNKDLPEDVNKKIPSINKVAAKLREHMEEAVKQVYFVQSAVNRALTVEAYIQEAVYDNFGKSAALFLRR